MAVRLYTACAQPDRFDLVEPSNDWLLGIMAIMQSDFTVGSGNVFADLGLPDADERLAKAQLAYRISKLVEARGWTHDEAADSLGIEPVHATALLDGRLSEFSLDRLIRMLNALDQEVEIIVRPNPSRERPAGVVVAA